MDHDSELAELRLALLWRWEVGAREYGDRSFSAPVAETLRQVLEETADRIGWLFVLWVQVGKLDPADRPRLQEEFLQSALGVEPLSESESEHGVPPAASSEDLLLRLTVEREARQCVGEWVRQRRWADEVCEFLGPDAPPPQEAP